MEDRTKQKVGELWQATAMEWKDEMASQYHGNCIAILEALLENFSAMNNDLAFKIDESLKNIERFENM